MLKNMILVGIGGAVGSVLRFWISNLSLFKTESGFPLSTLLINVLGSFIIGLLAAYFLNANTNQDLKFLMIAGFCGGFTTFSAFSLENLQLIKNGQQYLAIIYTLLSVSLGFIATWIGFKLLTTQI